ncbi:MAG: hypothetical protein RL494_961 [Bacteroidota bacterium]|jgi:outer membrane protein TolC
MKVIFLNWNFDKNNEAVKEQVVKHAEQILQLNQKLQQTRLSDKAEQLKTELDTQKAK